MLKTINAEKCKLKVKFKQPEELENTAKFAKGNGSYKMCQKQCYIEWRIVDAQNQTFFFNNKLKKQQCAFKIKSLRRYRRRGGAFYINGERLHHFTTSSKWSREFS